MKLLTSNYEKIVALIVPLMSRQLPASTPHNKHDTLWLFSHIKLTFKFFHNRNASTFSLMMLEIEKCIV